MHITIGPRSPGEAAGLADSWANRVRRALAEEHPRFEITTHAWQDSWDGQPPRRLQRTVALGPAGYPLYEISIGWAATQPERLSVGLRPVDASHSGPLKKPFKWLGATVAVILVGVWLYYDFFEADWGRVFSTLTLERTTKADRGHAFSALFGWAFGILIGYMVVWTGEWLDDKIDWLVRPGRQRHIDSELAPWLGGFISESAGSPVPGRPNLIYSASGDMQPAPGYTWAGDDPGSLDVRPSPDQA